jgi:hypothetical protein
MNLLGNIGKSYCLDKEFLDMTLRTQAIKTKLDKWVRTNK